MEAIRGGNGQDEQDTTVNQPRVQAIPCCDSRESSIDSPITEVAIGAGAVGVETTRLRSSRAWTFSTGNGRQYATFGHAGAGEQECGEHGLMGTPPTRSTSPHPLGYYSDSASPPLRSTSPATRAKSPLLSCKMVLTDSDDHSALAPPTITAHRASIGAFPSPGRRFSASVHHPHAYMPLAQQIHHSHLLMAQQQQHSSNSLFPPGFPANQRRRGSAATFSILSTYPVWDTPSGSSSNLNRLRRLGHSCPELNSSTHSQTMSSASSLSTSGQVGYRGPPVKMRRDIGVQRRHSNRMSRRSFNASTSPVMMGAGGPACPRCRSPLPQASPNSNSNSNSETGQGRPCVHHACSYQAGMGPPRRRNSLRVQCHDARRWSVTSLPSSGYGTPGSSAVSSQYSSQERLAMALEEQRHRYDSNDSNPSCENSAHGRLRSRSLSSIAWLNLSSSRLDSSLKAGEENVEIALRNNVYKERFPKAKRQMEDKLEAFVADNSVVSSVDSESSCQTAATGGKSSAVGNSGSGNNLTVPLDVGVGPRRASLTPPVVATNAQSLKVLSDGSARFIHHQIMELAMDCLQRSRNDSLSSSYFCEFSQNLEELLDEAKEKAAPEAVEQLSGLVKQLLLIVSRSARLLECLEFDPEEFYRVLQEAEGHAKEAQRQGVGLGVPQYIINQLGLNRCGPLEDLQCLTESTDSGNVTDTPTRGKVSSGISATQQHQATPPTPAPALAQASASAAIASDRHGPPKEGDFELIKLISNGAYGAVFLVRHKETHRRFALKKLSKSNLMLRNQIDQVYAERDILTFTDNPFVVSFYGSFETKRHLCMVMEYVEGGDCATLLKTIGVLPVEMARLYIAETVLAIEYLHSYGIVHRDLKPDNLLITALGHIKLTDFGLSKIGLMNRTNLMYEGYFDALMSETTQFQDRQICGTPEYIAPEVILRLGYGKPVDWWSLGIILYEFLVGTVPFFGETPEELFSHVINDETEWPEEPYAPPGDAQDLVTALLHQNPLERLGTVNGAIELKEHRFFASLDWNSLLRQKAEFIPQLEGEDDTSYFDTRADRYQHEFESGEDEKAGAETDRMCVSTHEHLMRSPFASFSSSSPRYSLLAEEMQKRSSESDSASASGGQRTLLDPNQTQIDDRTRRASAGLPSTTSDAPSPHLLSASDGTDVKWRRSSDVGPSTQQQTVLSTGKIGLVASPSTTISAVQPPTLPPRSVAPKHSRGPGQVESLKQVPSSRPQVAGPSPHHIRPGSGHSRPKHSVDPLRVAIPSDAGPMSPSYSSGGSSIDGSPTCSNRRHSAINLPGGPKGNKEIAPIINQLKPPIIIRRGAKGFGFTIRAIRVYLGETDYYTIQHLVVAVEAGSPACDAGLRPNDLLTHINGELVKNLTHTEVVQRLLKGGDAITLRVSPLESTSIRQGGPARKTAGKLYRRKAGGGKKQGQQKRGVDKSDKRRSSIIRRLSGKRGSVDSSADPMGVSHHKVDAAAYPNLAELAAIQRSVSNSDGPFFNPSLLKIAGERLIGGQSGYRFGRNSNSSKSNDSASSVDSNPANEASRENPNSGAVSSRPSSFFGIRSKVAQTLCPRRQASEQLQLSPLARPDAAIGTGVEAVPVGGKLSPSQAPTLLKPVPLPLAPVAQKKPIFKSKTSDSTSSEFSLASSQTDAGPGQQSCRNFGSRFDSGGSTSSTASTKSRSSMGKEWKQ